MSRIATLFRSGRTTPQPQSSQPPSQTQSQVQVPSLTDTPPAPPSSYRHSPSNRQCLQKPLPTLITSAIPTPTSTTNSSASSSASPATSNTTSSASASASASPVKETWRTPRVGRGARGEEQEALSSERRRDKERGEGKKDSTPVRESPVRPPRPPSALCPPVPHGEAWAATGMGSGVAAEVIGLGLGIHRRPTHSRNASTPNHSALRRQASHSRSSSDTATGRALGAAAAYPATTTTSVAATPQASVSTSTSSSSSAISTPDRTPRPAHPAHTDQQRAAVEQDGISPLTTRAPLLSRSGSFRATPVSFTSPGRGAGTSVGNGVSPSPQRKRPAMLRLRTSNLSPMPEVDSSPLRPAMILGVVSGTKSGGASRPTRAGYGKGKSPSSPSPRVPRMKRIPGTAEGDVFGERSQLIRPANKAVQEKRGGEAYGPASRALRRRSRSVNDVRRVALFPASIDVEPRALRTQRSEGIQRVFAAADASIAEDARGRDVSAEGGPPTALATDATATASNNSISASASAGPAQTGTFASRFTAVPLPWSLHPCSPTQHLTPHLLNTLLHLPSSPRILSPALVGTAHAELARLTAERERLLGKYDKLCVARDALGTQLEAGLLRSTYTPDAVLCMLGSLRRAVGRCDRAVRQMYVCNDQVRQIEAQLESHRVGALMVQRAERERVWAGRAMVRGGGEEEEDGGAGGTSVPDGSFAVAMLDSASTSSSLGDVDTGRHDELRADIERFFMDDHRGLDTLKVDGGGVGVLAEHDSLDVGADSNKGDVAVDDEDEGGADIDDAADESLGDIHFTFPVPPARPRGVSSASASTSASAQGSASVSAKRAHSDKHHQLEVSVSPGAHRTDDHLADTLATFAPYLRLALDDAHADTDADADDASTVDAHTLSYLRRSGVSIPILPPRGQRPRSASVPLLSHEHEHEHEHEQRDRGVDRDHVDEYGYSSGEVDFPHTPTVDHHHHLFQHDDDDAPTVPELPVSLSLSHTNLNPTLDIEQMHGVDTPIWPNGAAWSMQPRPGLGPVVRKDPSSGLDGGALVAACVPVRTRPLRFESRGGGGRGRAQTYYE